MSRPSTPVPSPKARSSRTLSSPTPSLEDTLNTSDDSPASTKKLSALYTSLMSTVKSPFTANAKMLVSIPINNNPRPLRSVFNDGADYWVGPDDNVLRIVFPAKLHLEGRYNKCGEYFNLPETGVSFRHPAADKDILQTICHAA